MFFALGCTYSDLRTGDPLLKKLRKTFTVGIDVDISLKCDCHADSLLSLNSYLGKGVGRTHQGLAVIPVGILGTFRRSPGGGKPGAPEFWTEGWFDGFTTNGVGAMDFRFLPVVGMTGRGVE